MNDLQPIAGPSSPRVTRSITRERVPLATLPLLQFAPMPALAPPSPLSISHKRAATGSPGGSGSGSRKVSRTDKGDSVRSAAGTGGGLGSGRRGDAEITPKVKERLERDDLGLGRSPARRLFMGGEIGQRSGISGTSPFPLNPSPSTPNTDIQSPFLAPSPPLSPRHRTSSIPSSSAAVEIGENGVQRSIHDPGFPIHSDLLGLGVGIGTPDSKRNTSLVPTPAHSPSGSVSGSPSTWARLEDQENVPPTSRAGSLAGSPKKRSQNTSSGASGCSSRSSASKSSAYEEEDTLLAVSSGAAGMGGGSGSGSPSGGGRAILGLGRSGRSKLIQMMRMRGPSGEIEVDTEPESDGEEAGELTPGKKGVDPRGKERLVDEGDRCA